jgi:hypothetical protein
MNSSTTKPGPSFCWHCNGDLSRNSQGGCIYAIVIDRDLNEHRVHKTCVEDATAEPGVTEIKIPKNISQHTVEEAADAITREILRSAVK